MSVASLELISGSTLLLTVSCLLSFSNKRAAAVETCLIAPFANSKATFFVRCPYYCCRSRSNASQYCCSDCNLSVSSSDACVSEQLWRYVLYVGLGISGAVVLCYLLAYLIKKCKGPLKPNCCRQRNGRVRDPGIAMTNASAWTGSAETARAGRTRGRRPPSSRVAEINDSDVEAAEADGCYDNDGTWHRHLGLPIATSLHLPPPPAYTSTPPNGNAAATSAAASSQEPTEPPPPNYSEAAAATSSPTAVVSVQAVEEQEPPPAYSAWEEPAAASQSESDGAAATVADND